MGNATYRRNCNLTRRVPESGFSIATNFGVDSYRYMSVERNTIATSDAVAAPDMHEADAYAGRPAKAIADVETI